jgi:hypothetical protein
MRGMPDDHRRERLTRLGRRIGIGVFALIVAGLTALWSTQIILQVWNPPPPTGPVPPSCRAGILGLASALERARSAAAQEANGERAALARFRQALGPEWDARPALEPLCQTDAVAWEALSQLSALRYAEEHAVRYEAVALAAQRRRVDALARSLQKDAAF